ncbi:PadR family transcriptional regulator [Caproicibacter sp.]|uniref:PadR family transcriptional regulator n=1 Tax=Caproicibacter sp. TaxID=2814884 RepID=UPI003988A369
MDTQLKKGVLDICVLAAVSQKDSYGYQIIRDVSTCVTISESTLYPILRRLESGGFLAVYSVAHNGRLRKYYRITEPGRRKIKDFFEEWQDLVQIHDFICQEAETDE